MTNEELIASARQRLAHHGAASPVMREMKAMIEALDAATPDAERYRYLRGRIGETVLSGSGPTAGCWIDSENESGELVLLTGAEADNDIDLARSKL